MKRIIIIAIFILATTAPAFAMSSRPHKPNANWHVLGSDDHQKKSQVQTYPEPNPPVSVPEPGTLLLLGSGLVALGAWKRMKK